MASIRIAILQMTSGIDPAANGVAVRAAAERAAADGAKILFTPEMTSCVDRDRARIMRTARTETADPTLPALVQTARQYGIWLAIGSMPLRLAGQDKLANRSFLIDDQGRIRARYDKIHLFDIDLGDGEQYHESATYAAGARACLAPSPLGPLGLTVCYDVRFPGLYERLAMAGARAIAVPSAFTRKTGAAHWESLLRARAIETLSFVIAAAQTGRHEDGRGTHGHSLVVDPWGVVLLDAGPEPGLHLVDLELDRVEEARRLIGSLSHRRPFSVDDCVTCSASVAP